MRRWGADALLSGSAYHIYFLGTPPASDPLVLRARCRSANTAVYVHASATPGVGVSPVSYTSTAVDAINTATNTPTAITAVGLSASGSLQKRVRLTSGVNANAHAFGLKADAATKLRTSEFLSPANFTTAPFPGPGITSAPPTSGNTFVVEDLRVVPGVHVDLLQLAPPSVVPAVILDGLSTTVSSDAPCSLYTNGCKISTVGPIWSHWLYGDDIVSLADDGFKRIYGGTTFVSLSIVGNAAVGNCQIDRFMLQGAISVALVGYPGDNGEVWRLGQVGAFDNTVASSQSVIVVSFVRLRVNSPTPVLWGSGNAGAFFAVDTRGVLAIGTGTLTQPFSTSSSGHVSIHDNLTFPRTSVPAFDPAIGYTGDRLLSFANIQATLANGGFNYRVHDPVTGARIIPG
jgi:hypothetical protein